MQMIKKLLNSIPIFPLNGAILLPRGNLPLNIFEPRYISMVNYAMTKDKLIGMIQTKNNNSKELYKIGCVGKIVNFNETEDNRYLINLKGISRFTISNEINTNYKFRIFNVKYNINENNYNNINKENFNKKNFVKKVRQFFEKQELIADWNSIEKIETDSLIILTSMLCPFSINEKQMLLESKNINILAKNIMILFDYYINSNTNNDSIN